MSVEWQPLRLERVRKVQYLLLGAEGRGGSNGQGAQGAHSGEELPLPLPLPLPQAASIRFLPPLTEALTADLDGRTSPNLCPTAGAWHIRHSYTVSDG